MAVWWILLFSTTIPFFDFSSRRSEQNFIPFLIFAPLIFGFIYFIYEQYLSSQNGRVFFIIVTAWISVVASYVGIFEPFGNINKGEMEKITGLLFGFPIALSLAYFAYAKFLRETPPE